MLLTFINKYYNVKIRKYEIPPIKFPYVKIVLDVLELWQLSNVLMVYIINNLLFSSYRKRIVSI